MVTRMTPMSAVAYCTIVHSGQLPAQMPDPIALLEADPQQAAGERVDLALELGVRPPTTAGHVDERLRGRRRCGRSGGGSSPIVSSSSAKIGAAGGVGEGGVEAASTRSRR